MHTPRSERQFPLPRFLPSWDASANHRGHRLVDAAYVNLESHRGPKMSTQKLDSQIRRRQIVKAAINYSARRGRTELGDDAAAWDSYHPRSTAISRRGGARHRAGFDRRLRENLRLVEQEPSSSSFEKPAHDARPVCPENRRSSNDFSDEIVSRNPGVDGKSTRSFTTFRAWHDRQDGCGENPRRRRLDNNRCNSWALSIGGDSPALERWGV